MRYAERKTRDPHYGEVHVQRLYEVLRTELFEGTAPFISDLGERFRYFLESAAERRLIASGVFRDIFGNPFRAVTVDPRWLTSSVLELAQSIYEGFPRQAGGYMEMGMLADALQDAGCDNEDLISHCRGRGPHVRGCWVVDLLLAKS